MQAPASKQRGPIFRGLKVIGKVFLVLIAIALGDMLGALVFGVASHPLGINSSNQVLGFPVLRVFEFVFVAVFFLAALKLLFGTAGQRKGVTQ